MLCRGKSERFQKYTHLQILVHLGVQKLVMPFCRTGNIPGPLHFWVFGIEARSDLADPKKKKKIQLARKQKSVLADEPEAGRGSQAECKQSREMELNKSDRVQAQDASDGKE